MSQRRVVNFSVLGVMLLVTGVTAAVAYAVHGYQVKRNAHVLLRHADLARERRDWDEAISYLERYVMLDPFGGAGPLAELGMLQAADSRRIRQAFGTLEAAIRQDPSRNDVRRRLVETAIAIDRLPDARNHLAFLLKESPDDHELIALLARVQIRAMQFPEAVKSLERVVSLAPDHVEYSALLAALLLNRIKDPVRAFAALDAMVDRNSTSPRAYIIRGQLRLEQSAVISRSLAVATTPADSLPGNPAEQSDVRAESTLSESGLLEGALADSHRALELAPDDEAAIGFAVRCRLANKQLNDASKLASRALRTYPRNLTLYLSLADIEISAGHFDEAADWYRRGLEALPKNRDLLWNLSNLLISRGQSEEFATRFAELRAAGHPQPLIAYLEVRDQIANKQWFDASRNLESIRASLVEFPDVAKQADFWLGECYQQLGRADLQLMAFRRAVSVDSNWIPARLGVASALLATGKVDESLDEYRLITASPKAPAFVLAQLARLWLLVNLRTNPSERQWSVPNQLLDRLEQVDPKSTSVPILRAEILFTQGEAGKAKELLLAARDQLPETMDYWFALVNLADRQDDPEKAETLLAEAKQANGDSIQLRLAYARHAVYRRQAGVNDVLRGLSTNLDAFKSEERTALYAGLAGLTLLIGDFDETARLCNLVAEEQPSSLQVRLVQFDLALRSRRVDAMEKALEDVWKIERSGPLWHYGKAVQMCLQAEIDHQPRLYDSAREHLTEARLARPNWSRIYVLLGLINEKQGNEDAAISNYVEAITNGDRDQSTVRRAVAMLYQRRRYLEADRLIRKLQEQDIPFSGEMAQLATEISLQLDDRDRALQLIHRSAAQLHDSKDFIWAGRILGALGKNDEAEEKLQHAVKLDPASPDGWVALIQHFGRTSQLTKAEAAITEAERSLSPEDAALALGQGYESIGNLQEAESKFKSALATSKESIPALRRMADYYTRHQENLKAEPLFQRVMQAGQQATEDDRLWARRNLAFIGVLRGTPAALKEALNLTETNLKAATSSDADRQMKALVLSRMPEKSAKLEAAQILEKILREHSSDVDPVLGRSRLALAQIHFSLGNLENADIQFRKLVSEHGDEPTYLSYYIRFLIHRNQITEAEDRLSQLTRLAPLDLNTLDLTTEVEFAQKRYQELLASIEAFLSASGGTEAEILDRSRTAALLLERYALRMRDPAANKTADDQWPARFLGRAEELLRHYAQKRPTDSSTLPSFLARTGRITESLDLLENRLSTVRPEEVLAITSSIVTSSTATKEHFIRADQLVQATLASKGRLAPLLTALAHVSTYLEKYADAERLYRELLALDGNDVITMNNLAILLALRGSGGAEPMNLLKRGFDITGINPVMLDSRATICFMQKDYVHAEEDINQSIAIRTTAGAYFRKALIEQKLGQLDAMREAWEKSQSLGVQLQELHPLERPMYRRLQEEMQKSNARL